MNILDKICQQKQSELIEKKLLYPTALLERSKFFETSPVSLKTYVQREDKNGIIAEIKRRSPSEGWLKQYADIETLSISYMQAGASALSILTDKINFGGSNEDLSTAREFNYCPILRKDFVLDEYQIIEAKSIGADAVLLIAAILSPKKTKALAQFARSLGLEVLLEIHTEEELIHLNEYISIVGVNNRNLNTMTTDIRQSIQLAPLLPKELCTISESGINNANDIQLLRKYGYNGFLIGTSFMKQNEPGFACKQLVEKLKSTNNVHQNMRA